MAAHLIDMVGRRYKQFVFLENTGQYNRHNKNIWRVRCDCGTEFQTAAAYEYRTGRLSGKCSHHDSHTEQLRYKELYHIWQGINQRCYNPKTPSFKRYGGRGIIICDRWKSFENFAADTPERPKPWEDWSIDRIDCNGNYELSNVRWATRTQQQNNRQYNVRLPFDASHLTRQRRQQIAKNLNGLCCECENKLAPFSKCRCVEHFKKTKLKKRISTKRHSRTKANLYLGLVQ